MSEAGASMVSRRRPFPAAALLLLMVMGLPILWLAAVAIGASIAGSNGFAATMLPGALRETGTLMLSVGIATSILGLISAWLVTHFDFPGRRILEWALILPLAVPTYLAAYSYVEFLGFTGPVQELFRTVNGATTLNEYWFPDVRTQGGAAVVLSLVLYPYVYAACRAFFLMRSNTADLAARAMGASAGRTFLRITLPLAWPAIVVGATLAMMEVLNDLGAVQYFGVNSLTAVIYSTWINRSDFPAAAQLAVTIVLVIGLLILAEQAARRNRVYSTHRDNRVPPSREVLDRWRGGVATVFCALLVMLGFGIPCGELAWLAFRAFHLDTLGATVAPMLTTLTLALIGASITVAIGFFAAHRSTPRADPVSRGAVRIATLGYAIPGTVLALGLLQPLGVFDLWFNRATVALFDWRPGLILSGSVVALLYVYAIRFHAVSHSTLEAAMRKRGPSMLEAGRVLGAKGVSLFFRIDVPTLWPALLAAATLVFVEIVKELPATLLLRPLGVETLATVVYARANAAQFAEAALPALAIVLVGLVPVILATKFSDGR